MAYFVPLCDQPADIDVQPGYGDGSAHEVSCWVAKDVADGRRNLCILAKEAEFIANLEPKTVNRLSTWRSICALGTFHNNWVGCS